MNFIHCIVYAVYSVCSVHLVTLHNDDSYFTKAYKKPDYVTNDNFHFTSAIDPPLLDFVVFSPLQSSLLSLLNIILSTLSSEIHLISLLHISTTVVEFLNKSANLVGENLNKQNFYKFVRRHFIKVKIFINLSAIKFIFHKKNFINLSEDILYIQQNKLL